MESTSKSKPGVKPDADEIDLGHLFYRTGGVISNFFNWIGRMVVGIGETLLKIIFFLRRNLIWLLIGAAAGLAYGIFLLSKNGVKYNSKMTVRTNYNSSRSLYGAIDFFNALCNNGRVDELSKIFKITPAAATTLRSFSAEPVESEMVLAEMYRDKFLQQKRIGQEMDTFWIRTVNYKDFKASLTEYDYPIHTITVVSNSAVIFPSIQEGIIEQISSNKLLQDIKTSGEETNKEVVDMLTGSIKSLDTLRNTYNKRLLAGNMKESTGNNITMVEGKATMQSPELEVYDKLLELKDELRIAKNQAVLENNIIQVYSPFNSVGQKESFLRQNIVRYTIFGFVTALALLIIIGLYKYLQDLELRLQKKKQFS